MTTGPGVQKWKDLSSREVQHLKNSTRRGIDSRLADGSLESSYIFDTGGGITFGHADSYEEVIEILRECPAFDYWRWEVRVYCSVNRSEDGKHGEWEQVKFS